MKKIYLLFILLSFGFGASGQKANRLVVTNAVKARIDSTLKAFVDSSKIVGVSALIVEKNNEVYFNAYGYADREAKKPMDRNTIVRIFSMTKPVTGTALMKLYEKGAFKLDDPLSKYAPEFANLKVFKSVGTDGSLVLEPLKRPVTIRDITRHTAGFADSYDAPGVGPLLKSLQPGAKENTLTQMAEKLGTIPLMFQPGEQWAYGPSVDVQAFLVERISGKPFDQFIRENILDPLAMKKTRYTVPASDLKNFAAMYRRADDGTLTRIPDEEANTFYTRDWPMKPGGWGLTSTVDDYMRFARMLVNKGRLGDVTILKPETVKLMATNQLSDSITKRMWLPSKGQVGFGIDFAVRLRPPVSRDENNGVVGEFFWDGAASTLFWVDPVNDLTAVLFVQLMPFDKVKLHKNFRDAIYGKYSPPVASPSKH